MSNLIKSYYTSERLLHSCLTALMVLVLLFSLVPSATGAPLFTTMTNNIPAEIDDRVGVRIINMPSEIVEAVRVSINFEKMSQSSWPGCVALGGSGHNGSSSYSDEITFRLESPSGTNVDLVFDDDSTPTYTSTSQYPGVVTVVFDDKAAKQVGGSIPVSGTFRPEEPLSKFIGEDAGGEWKLYAGDNEGSDPLCLNQWSLIIDSGWKDPSISGIYGGEKRCKLTAIDSRMYIGSDNYFTARGLGVPDKLRFSQDGVVSGFLYPGDYGFEDGKWKIVSNLQSASGLPMFEPGIYHVSCFGPGGTTGTPLRTVISR